MVNKDSNLYHLHPQWVLQTPNRTLSHGRHQYVLDFSNPEVVQYIYQMLYKILSTSHISYIKWDMNRSMSEVYSSCHDHEHQGRCHA